MNMAKLLLMLAVMAIIPFGASASNDRSAQIMHERNVPPSVLADRIDRECTHRGKIDANCKPSGSNATVADFATSIRGHASGLFMTVTPDQVPSFLRSLEGRLLPPNLKMCLSGMRGSEVVTTCKGERLPHPGEMGWYRGETLVLAGDCGNSVVPLSAKKMDQMVVEEQLPRWRPYAVEDGGALTSDAPSSEGGECPLQGARLTTVHVFEARTLNASSCAQKYVIDPDRYTSGKGTIGGWVNTGSEDVFSLRCGQEVHQMEKAGQISASNRSHRVELFLVQGQKKQMVFSGSVTGFILDAADENSGTLLTRDRMAVEIPIELQTGVLVWVFPDGGMASPMAPKGAGMNISRLKATDACVPRPKVASAIEE